ncbi:MAG: hypothetical protein LBT82_02260 [Oscillospiraceae bacterium]|nr:hypothetical protein [Oscillospiraceae bacterium]
MKCTSRYHKQGRFMLAFVLGLLSSHFLPAGLTVAFLASMLIVLSLLLIRG